MSQADRGLFEQMLKFLDENTIEDGWYNDAELKRICAEFEQQLTDSNKEIGVLKLIQHDLTNGITGTLQKDHIEKLERQLAEANSALKWVYTSITKNFVIPVMTFDEWYKAIKQESKS